MPQREKVVWAVSLVVVALLGAFVGRYLAQHAPPPPVSLRIGFDGGYVFDFDQPDAVNVAALRKANYPMKLRVVSPKGIPDIDLTGYTASLLPDGSAPSRVQPILPPSDPTQINCDKANDVANMNNRFFIPDLKDVASRMGTALKANPDVAATFELTGGGAISVSQLGGCVQYRDAEDHDIADLPSRAMVSGIGGVAFDWQHIAQNKVVLQLKAADGTTKSTDIVPGADQQIVLRVSAFEAAQTLDNNPHKIAHFKDHFDDAFGTIAANKRISLWWLGTYIDSPGIDCPTGGR